MGDEIGQLAAIPHTEQRLDRASLDHRSVTLRHLFERQRQVEHLGAGFHVRGVRREPAGAEDVGCREHARDQVGWRNLGCTGTPQTTNGNCSTYSTCNGGVETTLCTVQGGGHTWGNSTVAWSVIKDYSLP